MASIPELLNGHVTLEVECLDRLYLNGYIGPLAASGGLVTFMREQLGKPIPSPVLSPPSAAPSEPPDFRLRPSGAGYGSRTAFAARKIRVR